MDQCSRDELGGECNSSIGTSHYCVQFRIKENESIGREKGRINGVIGLHKNHREYYKQGRRH